MKKLLFALFYYTRTERMGIICLCAIALGLLFLPQLFPLWSSPKQQDFSAFKTELAQLAEDESPSVHTETQTALFSFDPNQASLAELQRLGLSPKVAQTILNYREKGGQFKKAKDFQKIYAITPAEYDRLKDYIVIPNASKSAAANFYPKQKSTEIRSPLTPFAFDPNTASQAELSDLGLSQKVIRTILNFRNKGGKFYQKEDLQKIYGLQTTDYETLAPYIQIPPKSPPTLSSPIAKAGIPNDIPRSFEKVSVIIDINQAAAADWEQLRGIGPSYAKRIISFRDKLGGFINIEQVAETYHLPDSTFQAIRPFLRPSAITAPLAINTAEAKQLQAHPYLNWKQANAIVNYRMQHGHFTQKEDLYKLHALPKAVVDKIIPYLKL